MKAVIFLQLETSASVLTHQSKKYKDLISRITFAASNADCPKKTPLSKIVKQRFT